MKNLVHQRDYMIQKKELNFTPKQTDTSLFQILLKKDFGNHYPSLICSKPSMVIWHGNNFDTNEVNVQKKNQFLFVGSRNGYKNFDNAYLAFEKTLEQYQDCFLMIMGSALAKKKKTGKEIREESQVGRKP